MEYKQFKKHVEEYISQGHTSFNSLSYNDKANLTGYWMQYDKDYLLDFLPNHCDYEQIMLFYVEHLLSSDKDKLVIFLDKIKWAAVDYCADTLMSEYNDIYIAHEIELKRANGLRPYQSSKNGETVWL